MKAILVLSAVAALANALPLEARQEGHSHGGAKSGMGGMGGMGGMSSALGGSSIDLLGPLLANPALLSMASNFIPKKAATKIESIAPKLRKEAKRIRITYGPYELKGKNSKGKFGNTASLDPAGTAYAYLASSDFPRDVSVLQATSQVVGENMLRAETTDGIYNHHNVFFDFSQKVVSPLGCADPKVKPSGIVPVSVFMAGATETGDLTFTSDDGKYNSAYYIGPKDVIYNGIDVVNYNNDTRTVYTVSEMEYIPGKIPGAQAATMQTINLGLCSGINGVEIRPPPGTKNFTIDGQGMLVTTNGYLLNTRGHLHDGGENMLVKINGKIACDSRVLYGGPGHEYTLPSGEKIEAIRTTTECTEPIEVRKGDTVDVSAFYDFSKHPQRETADGEMAEDMALLLLTFVEKV